jgi:hypothetical protein
LPLYHDLKEEEVEKIAGVILYAFADDYCRS